MCSISERILSFDIPGLGENYLIRHLLIRTLPSRSWVVQMLLQGQERFWLVVIAGCSLPKIEFIKLSRKLEHKRNTRSI